MGIIISLPISLLLLWLVLKPKKDDSFPKGGLWRLLIAGAISTILSAILSQVLSLSLAAIRIGPGTFFDAIQTFRSDPAKGNELMANLSANKVPSPLWTLFTTLITAGLRKEGMIRTWMDVVICFTVVGLTFQVLENLLYGGQYGIFVAIFRNLAPGHFIFGVIMGWYYGKYLITGEKKYRIQSIFWPALIHTLFDTALRLMPSSKEGAALTAVDKLYIVLGLLAFVAAFISAIVIVVKLVNWRKKGTLNQPVHTPNS